VSTVQIASAGAGICVSKLKTLRGGSERRGKGERGRDGERARERDTLQRRPNDNTKIAGY